MSNAPRFTREQAEYLESRFRLDKITPHTCDRTIMYQAGIKLVLQAVRERVPKENTYGGFHRATATTV